LAKDLPYIRCGVGFEHLADFVQGDTDHLEVLGVEALIETVIESQDLFDLAAESKGAIGDPRLCNVDGVCVTRGSGNRPESSRVHDGRVFSEHPE